MAIEFNSANNQFYLHTQNSSYVMELYEGCLAHVYWGSRLDRTPSLDELYPFRFGSAFSPGDLPGRRFSSTDKLPQEYPTHGSADLRSPALCVRHSTGDGVSRLRYLEHRIYRGKKPLPGLPAAYGDDCETLEITLLDALPQLQVILSYSVFPDADVITRSVRIVNNAAAPCTLEQVASVSMDIHGCDFEAIHLPGTWARERHIERLPVCHGALHFGSTRGASSHTDNPFFALVSPDTTETAGDAYGFMLVYSGNFCACVGADQFDNTRVQLGIHPLDFAWTLQPGESFQTPEAILVHSGSGLGEMSRRFHRFLRKHICRGKFRDTTRPVLINNWEATYFDFNEEKILSLATKAKAIGVELLVLDDGWFGKRDKSNSSLGDWMVDRRKLPEGLEGLARKVNALGLEFGLWFEPEMISPDSDLYRAHPDWCIHVEGRSRTLGRNQLILDLSRVEIQQYVIDAVSNILANNPISYVKWDMNRNMTEVPYPGYPHRYMLGLYRILEEITGRFPDVLFESCSGGGGRFDAGMLYYMPQAWTSDDTDGVERLYIQEGTGLGYPISGMGAHISAVPNHQVGRVTPLKFRSAVAMMGRFGLELDLGKLESSELDILRQEIAFYKTYQQVIHQGDLYRLLSPYHDRCAAYQILSQDKNTVMVFVHCIRGRPTQPPRLLRLQGLEGDAEYRLVGTETLRSGSSLMNAGIPIDTRTDMTSAIYIFTKCSE